MNIDFHVHGLISKRNSFNKSLFLQEIEYAKEDNIDGIVLCEHFQAIAFKDIYRYLDENYTYNGKYLVNGVSVFPAMEVSIKDKGHVVLVSGREEILQLNHLLEENMNKSNFIDFKDLLDLADEYNCIKVGAHPFRKGQQLCKKEYELLERLDCIELNAKDIYKYEYKVIKNKLNTLSKEINKIIIGGSDSHTPLQIGAIKTILNGENLGLLEIKQRLLQGNVNIEISNSLDFKVYTSKVLKRYIMSKCSNYTSDTIFKI